MRLGVITDVHLNPPGTPAAAWHNPYHLADAAGRFAHAIQYCVAADVDALAILGDLSHLGDAPSLAAGVAQAAAAPMPVLFVPGNHDVTAQPLTLATTLAQHAAAHVRLAAPAGEVIAGVRVAGLPALSGTTWWDAAVETLPAAEHWGNELVVLLSHFPVLSLAATVAQAGLRYPGDLVNLPAVREPITTRAQPTVVLHGHAHVRATVTAQSVVQFGCGALIEPPFEVAIVTVTAHPRPPAVQIVYHAIAASAVERLPVLTPARAKWVYAKGAWTAAAER